MTKKLYLRSKTTTRGKHTNKHKLIKRSNKRTKKRARIARGDDYEEDKYQQQQQRKLLQEFKEYKKTKNTQNTKRIEENKQNGTYLEPEEPNNPNAVLYIPQLEYKIMHDKLNDRLNYEDAKMNGLAFGIKRNRRHKSKSRRRISK